MINSSPYLFCAFALTVIVLLSFGLGVRVAMRKRNNDALALAAALEAERRGNRALREADDESWSEVLKLRDQLGIARIEIDRLVWNLAGCDTYASGAGLDKPHNADLARPALDNVRRLALERHRLREALVAVGSDADFRFAAPAPIEALRLRMKFARDAVNPSAADVEITCQGCGSPTPNSGGPFCGDCQLRQHQEAQAADAHEDSIRG